MSTEKSDPSEGSNELLAKVRAGGTPSIVENFRSDVAERGASNRSCQCGEQSPFDRYVERALSMIETASKVACIQGRLIMHPGYLPEINSFLAEATGLADDVLNRS